MEVTGILVCDDQWRRTGQHRIDRILQNLIMDWILDHGLTGLFIEMSCSLLGK